LQHLTGGSGLGRRYVPHDWSIEGEYDQDNPTGGRGGYLPAGIGWYRRTIEIPEEWIGNRKVSILFDGVYMNSKIYLNGKEVGGRPYGYISFACDLTKDIRPGKNTLAVRIDTKLAPSSRWYTGSGIYGHVRLIATRPIYVPLWGTYVTTPKVSEEQATVVARTEVTNGTDVEQIIFVDSTMRGPGATTAPAASDRSQVKLAAGETKTVEQTFEIAQPLLWSPEEPTLYLLRTKLETAPGGPDDIYETTFGIRSIRFDAQKGFLLNGKQVKLKGVCEHHDGGPVGAAFPDRVLERRLQILKAMGCNAIRTAHNPRTPIFYEMCDRMGIMVMDEIFDGWHRKAEHDYGARFFKDWWQRDVTDWIRRDRNHPCVVMWSIGNETGHTDKNDITGFIHQLDRTRPTTGGTIFHGVDVAGFNGPGGKPGVLEKFHAENPDRPVVLTEVPHTLQTRGHYRVRTWWRDKGAPRHNFPAYGEKQIFFDGHPRFSSAYDNCGVRISARTCWKRTAENDWISGEFRWTGFDYLGEASFSGGKWPARIWNFGIIDLAGFPKDHYYFYQSQWVDAADLPMVHLLPHWTHPTLEEGTDIPVVAYSNCDEVELFLDSKSLGKKTRGELLDFVWKVPYRPGELRAVAYLDGKPVAASVRPTARGPNRILFSSDNFDLKPDRRDIAHVTFSVVDSNGTVVPWSNDRIDFKITGPVKLLGFENGNPVDVTPHRANHRTTFAGLGLGIFQATDENGIIELIAAGVLGRRRFEQSTTVAIDVQRCMLRGMIKAGPFKIHYTTDGSEPTLQSPVYEAPLTISETTTVRALIASAGYEIMRTEAELVRGPIEPVSDPRWAEGADDQTTTGAGGMHVGPVKPYQGPFDKELIGRWREMPAGKTFEFRADGVFCRIDDGKQNPVAYWWYDFPNDTFENPDDPGQGELCWKNSGHRTKLKLVDQKAEMLKISGGKGRTFKKVDP